jgi:hypothetical protein
MAYTVTVRAMTTVFALLAVAGIALAMASAQDVSPGPRALEEIAYVEYEEASRAYENGRYIEAGILYRRADIAAHSAAALIQAARSYWAAGDMITASRLSVIFILRFAKIEDVTGIDAEDYVICSPLSRP